MLSPSDRILLAEALQPPEGYALDHALIATYSLDLTALMTVPLALTYFDWSESDGKPRVDPVALLEALRRYSERLTVVCQAGRIAIPDRQQNLFAFFESAVREVAVPSGSFHPKVTLLRYIPVDNGEDSACYRLLCGSRNLTFDRSLDVLTVLEGWPATVTESKATRPLIDFVDQVREWTVQSARGLDSPRAERLQVMTQELRRIAFDPPDGFNSVTLHALGLDERSSDLFEGRCDRMVAISPFVSSGGLARLRRHGVETLIARQEELDALPEDALEDLEKLVLKTTALPEPSDADVSDGAGAADAAVRDPESPDLALQGLHAKVYVIDAGGKARVLAGSANATESGFGRSVEFMVALEGSKGKAGVDALLGDSSTGLRTIVAPYVRDKEFTLDADLEQAEQMADDVASALAQSALELHCIDDGSSAYQVQLVAPSGLPDLDNTVVSIWPFTLSEDRAETLTTATALPRWQGLAPRQITAFLACRVTATVGQSQVTRGISLMTRLVGVPENRDRAIVRAVLESPERFMRYLAFLLADPDRDLAGALDLADPAIQEPGWHPGETPAALRDDFPLFEHLARALDRDPERIDRIASLVADVASADNGEDVLPEGFEQVWDPVREARLALKGTRDG